MKINYGEGAPNKLKCSVEVSGSTQTGKIAVENQGVEKFKLKLLTYLALDPKQSDIKSGREKIIT